MSLELDFYRFTVAAKSLTDAYIQLCKYPFSWAGEAASDWTKYPIGMLVLFTAGYIPHIGVDKALETCFGLWVVTSVILVFINWKDGNMGK